MDLNKKAVSKYLHLSLLVVFLLLSGGCTNHLENQISLFLIDGQNDKALNAVKSEIAIDPKNAALYYLAAKIYYKKNDLNKASLQIKKAIVFDPFHAEYHLLASKVYLDSHQYLESAQAATTAIKFDESLLNGYWILGQTYEKTFRYTEALKQYNLALSLEPFFLKARLSAVRSAFHIDNSLANTEKLIDELTETLIIYPNHKEGHLLLVSLLESIGQTYQAEQTLMKLLARDRQSEGIQYELAKFYLRLQRMDQAEKLISQVSSDQFKWKLLELRKKLILGDLENLKKALKGLNKTQNKTREILLIRAESAYIEGDLRNSAIWLRKLQSNYPESSEGFWLKTLILESKNDQLGALFAVQRAITLNRYNPEYRLKEIRLLARLEKWKEVDSLMNGIAIKPSSFYFRYLKADLAFWRKNYQEALKLYLQLSKDEYIPEIEKQIARLDIKENRRTEAVKRLNKLIKAFPKDVETRAILSSLFYISSQFDKAVEQLNKILNATSNLGNFHLLLGETYFAAGNNKMGLLTLKNGVKHWRDNLRLVDAYTFYLGVFGKYKEGISILLEYSDRPTVYRDRFLKRLADYYQRSGDQKRFRKYIHEMNKGQF